MSKDMQTQGPTMAPAPSAGALRAAESIQRHVHSAGLGLPIVVAALIDRESGLAEAREIIAMMIGYVEEHPYLTEGEPDCWEQVWLDNAREALARIEGREG